MQPQVALRYAREELFNVHLYTWLARTVHNPTLKPILEKFAAQEKAHYDFWKRWVSEEVRYPTWWLWWYKVLIRLLGISFILRLLERREHQTIAEYRQVAPTLPPQEQTTLLALVEEEEKHEAEFLEAIRAEEPRIQYLGFIVLGLSDAIIEITGVHAGFLGASHRPLTAGIAGLIVGFAASISMASAAYLQAKQNPAVSAVRSAVYTGISYVIAVVLMALPYFALASMAGAFWTSVILAVGMILSFVYYSAVVFERSFRQEALESVGVLGATAILSYGFGEVLRYFFPDALV